MYGHRSLGGVEHLENHLSPDRITGMNSRQDKIKKNPAAGATHRHHVIVSSCHHVIVSSCHHVIMSSCHRVIVSSCHHVIVSSCHRVIVSSCHRVIMSSCHHVIVTGLNDDFVCNVRVGRLSERGRGRGLSVCNLTTRSDIPRVALTRHLTIRQPRSLLRPGVAIVGTAGRHSTKVMGQHADPSRHRPIWLGRLQIVFHALYDTPYLRHTLTNCAPRTRHIRLLRMVSERACCRIAIGKSADSQTGPEIRNNAPLKYPTVIFHVRPASIIPVLASSVQASSQSTWQNGNRSTGVVGEVRLKRGQQGHNDATRACTERASGKPCSRTFWSSVTLIIRIMPGVEKVYKT
eukprot:1192149-Prorocentrum_minimum.AAC.2